MGAIIEVDYYNTFILKKTIEGTNTMSWNGSFGVPPGVDGGYPVISSTTNQPDSWAIEESRVRGGYNNTTVELGPRAFIVEDEPNSSIRFNSLIYSGIYNSTTGVNDTNVFSVGDDITKSADPANGSIQKLYAEDTNLVIFQENKVSRALIDKDAIYTAEGSTSISNINTTIGTIQPFVGNFGISQNPESFAVYGYRKYFTDKDRNAVMRLSRDGLTEISNYGMIDYFRDQFDNLDQTNDLPGKALGSWDIYNKQYVLSLQQNPNANNPTFNTLSFDEQVLGWPSFFTYEPDQAISIQSDFYTFKDGSLYKHYVDNFDAATGLYDRNTFYGVSSNSSITFVFNPKVSMSKVFKTVNYEGSSGWKISEYKASRSFDLNDTANVVLSNAAGLYEEQTIQEVIITNAGAAYGLANNVSVATTGAGTGFSCNITQVSGTGAIQSVVINQVGTGYKNGENLTVSGGNGVAVLQIDSVNTSVYNAGFYLKEGKYYASIVNSSPATAGEVVFGDDMTGVKGYYAVVKIETGKVNVNQNIVDAKTQPMELFAVSSEYVESAY
jgi:hypothetical protein